MGGIQSTIEVNDQTYTILKKIDKGYYTTVYLTRRQSDGKKCILKKISVNNNSVLFLHGKEEIEIMKRLSSKPNCRPYIVCLYDSKVTSDFIYIIMEYINGSDMFDYILNYRKLNKTFIDFDTFNKWFRQAIIGLCFIHKLGIIHRDIKPSNILIDVNKNLKFIDFGMSTPYSKEYNISTNEGTECFLEPYLKSACYYTDIYALGITFISIISDEFCDTQMLSKIIDSIQFPSKYKYYKTLLHEMIKPTADRPSAQEISDFINSNGTKPLLIEDYKKCLKETGKYEIKSEQNK